MLRHSAIRSNRPTRRVEMITQCFSIQDYEFTEVERCGREGRARGPAAAPPGICLGLRSTVLVSPRGFLTDLRRPAAHEYPSWRRTKDASQVNALRLTCSVFLDAVRDVRCAGEPACAMGPTVDAPTSQRTARCAEKACASIECDRRPTRSARRARARRTVASWCFGGAAVSCYSMAIDLAHSRLLRSHRSGVDGVSSASEIGLMTVDSAPHRFLRQ